MATQIFVNLHVKDLEKSKKFYTAIGFTINPQFTDDTAACVVISDTIFIMLITHAKFREFTPKEISDAHKTTEVLNALSAESKDQVNAMVDKAIQSGGGMAGQPQDHGFMFSRSFNDPDGHIWEVFWMDMSQVPQ